MCCTNIYSVRSISELLYTPSLQFGTLLWGTIVVLSRLFITHILTSHIKHKPGQFCACVVVTPFEITVHFPKELVGCSDTIYCVQMYLEVVIQCTVCTDVPREKGKGAVCIFALLWPLH